MSWELTAMAPSSWLLTDHPNSAKSRYDHRPCGVTSTQPESGVREAQGISLGRKGECGAGTGECHSAAGWTCLRPQRCGEASRTDSERE